MELYEAILYEALVKEIMEKTELKYADIIEMKCYQAIKEIYAVVADDTLEDPECFRRVEQIVCVLDELGIGGGGRHDF